jgi:hypothetical protein
MFLIQRRRGGWERREMARALGEGCGAKAYKNRISMNDNHIQFNLIFQRRKAKSEVERGWMEMERI